MIGVDGSFGEGGGQIIRTSIALAALTNQPCRIYNIRAKRKNPGLQSQHCTAINAVAKLCDAKLDGAELNSQEITFRPNQINTDSISLDIGTAGSIALVLQTLMIAAYSHKLRIKIIGGTVNKWAPSVFYLQNVTLEMLKKFGYAGEIKIMRHGFYPKGGGIVEAAFSNSKIKKISILDRGKLRSIKGFSTSSKDLQKQQVAERMAKYACDSLKEFDLSPELETSYVDTNSTGASIDLFAVYENSILGSNSIAEKEKRSEDVADEAVRNLKKYHDSRHPIDPYLADQLIPYIALSGGEIKAPITEHTKTNIWVCEKFLPVKFTCNQAIRATFLE